MQAIHGGTAKNDQIAAHTIAVLLRGGMRPQAYGYPAAMRATRDLLRRRTSLARKRAALLPHGQNTNRQDNLPELGKKLAYKANRDGVAERFADPAVHKSRDMDLARLDAYDQRLRAVELALGHMAKQHEAHTLDLLRPVPGIGKILRLVLLDAIHDICRFPRVQEFGAYGRLVTCAKESAGKRDGPSGQTIGHAHLKGAFSEAAILFLRNNPAGQQYLARLAKNQGKGKAWTVLAHQLARAVYSLVQRHTAFDLDQVLNEERSGAGEPDASLAPNGMSLGPARWTDGALRR
jgi:transposase